MKNFKFIRGGENILDQLFGNNRGPEANPQLLNEIMKFAVQQLSTTHLVYGNPPPDSTFVVLPILYRLFKNKNTMPSWVNIHMDAVREPQFSDFEYRPEMFQPFIQRLIEKIMYRFTNFEEFYLMDIVTHTHLDYETEKCHIIEGSLDWENPFH